jgi:hypothetical protein
MMRPDKTSGTAACIVQRFQGFGGERDAVERELAANGVLLPVPQRAQCQQAFQSAETVMFVARDGDKTPRAALSASISRSRALPRHRIYRVERWMGSGSETADHAILDEFARAIRGDKLCLRATIELFSFEEGGRERHAEQLRALGFVRASVPRMYSQTLMIDLAPTEDELFAALPSKARRDVRAPAKKGLTLRPITDPALGDRLDFIFNETFRRTGTVAESRPWRRIIELSASEPGLSRLVGIFNDAIPTPDGLVAFAWGCAQGDYATYEAGASIRSPELGNTPLSYAPLWDLVAWARRAPGLARFDLGGVTAGGPNDPRHGISEFKRYFSDKVVQVAEEWTMEPAPLRASLARAISQGVRRANEIRERSRAGREEAGRKEQTPVAPAVPRETPSAPSAPTT